MYHLITAKPSKQTDWAAQTLRTNIWRASQEIVFESQRNLDWRGQRPSNWFSSDGTRRKQIYVNPVHSLKI